MEKFDFTENYNLQDMIYLIMKDKNLSKEDALKYAINKDAAIKILEASWAPIALDKWGHADPNRKWNNLENPIIEIEFDKEQHKLIDLIMQSKKTNRETAISYFILFSMNILGYHI